MFKRAISVALASTMLLLSLSGCGGGNNEQSSASSSSGGVEVDENLLSVEITMPASFFEGTDMSTFNPESYAAEQGFKKAVVNEDGSIKVTMSKAKHKEIMEQTAKTVTDAFDGMVKAEDTPYITAIGYSKDFASVKISVDKAGYDAAGFAAAFVPFGVYLQTAIYQMFANVEAHCEIQIIDAATNAVIDSVVYPDAMNSES